MTDGSAAPFSFCPSVISVSVAVKSSAPLVVRRLLQSVEKKTLIYHQVFFSGLHTDLTSPEVAVWYIKFEKEGCPRSEEEIILSQVLFNICQFFSMKSF